MDIDKKNLFIDYHDSCTVLITNYKEIIHQIKEIHDLDDKKEAIFLLLDKIQPGHDHKYVPALLIYQRSSL